MVVVVWVTGVVTVVDVVVEAVGATVPAGKNGFVLPRGCGIKVTVKSCSDENLGSPKTESFRDRDEILSSVPRKVSSTIASSVKANADPSPSITVKLALLAFFPEKIFQNIAIMITTTTSIIAFLISLDMCINGL